MDADAIRAWDDFVSTTIEFLSKHPHQSPDLRAKLTIARLEAMARLTPNEFKAAVFEASGLAWRRPKARRSARI